VTRSGSRRAASKSERRSGLSRVSFRFSSKFFISQRRLAATGGFRAGDLLPGSDATVGNATITDPPRPVLYASVHRAQILLGTEKNLPLCAVVAAAIQAPITTRAPRLSVRPGRDEAQQCAIPYRLRRVMGLTCKIYTVQQLRNHLPRRSLLDG
jgi:hypothetical protein